MFDGLAFTAGVAHHDFDIIAAALDALRFHAIEGGAYLAAEVVLAQAEGEGAGLEL